jgi:hypothetical protein
MPEAAFCLVYFIGLHYWNYVVNVILSEKGGQHDLRRDTKIMLADIYFVF